MTDQPKLHAYAVACAFGTPEDTDPPARLIVSVWVGYRPEEAAAIAMDQTHRTLAAAGQKLAPHAGTTMFEITEDHLSHMLNALRTGGKGATVTPLQQVPPEPNPAPAVQQKDANYWDVFQRRDWQNVYRPNQDDPA